MKIQLLAICMCLSIIANTQSFQWDNNNQRQSPKTESNQQTLYSNSEITPNEPMVDELGIAHPYPDYYDGSPTALGEVFHQNQLTAGHKTLPLGTIVTIARIDNGLSTTVRINDRGAYCDGCIIDLSNAAAQQIGLLSDKKTNVALTVIGMSDINPSTDMASTTAAQFVVKGGSQSTTKAYETTAPTTQYNIPPPVCGTANKAGEHVALPAFEAEIKIIDAPIAPFAVQLGSYVNYSNAKKHAFLLQNKGFNNVYLLKEKRVGQDPLNRVIVTPFSSLNEAESYIDDLKEYHGMKGLVFQTMLIEVDD